MASEGRRILIAALLLMGFLPSAQLFAQPLPSPTADASAVRLEMPLFGDTVQIEVRDAERSLALAAIRKALLTIHGFAVLTEPGSLLPGSLDEINRRPETAIPVSDTLFDFLVHGTRYCLWSNGYYGPTGDGVYELWNQRRSGREFQPMELRQAVADAGCDSLLLGEGPPKSVTLTEGTQLSGFGLDRGFALDLGMTELRRAGIDNAIIETRELIAAMGPGSTGRGWLVKLPGVEGSRQPLEQFFLLDQSLAWVVRHDSKERQVPLSLRTGVPTVGVRLVAAVTYQAADAEALAHTLYAMGKTVGQRHVGTLNPRPSIFWLLGIGDGLPLEAPYRWSEMDRVR